MRISGHAVENYIDRVLGLDDDQVTESVEEFAREQIKKAAREPEEVYQDNGQERENCPIHMRNMAAVPVKNGSGESEELFVPTVYHAALFMEKMEN